MFAPMRLDALASRLDRLATDTDDDLDIGDAALALRYFAAKARMDTTARALTIDLERLMDEYGPGGVLRAARDLVVALEVEGRPVAPAMPTEG